MGDQGLFTAEAPGAISFSGLVFIITPEEIIGAADVVTTRSLFKI
jgi:hypothetical protein